MRHALALVLACTPVPIAAQSLGLDPDHDLPSWMQNWSSLNSEGLSRRLPSAGRATSAQLYGAPRIGTFWTAGNPAGLVEGIRDARSDFSAAWSRQSGSYRRPLDPGAARLLQGSAQAWRGFSPNFSLLGRVSFDQERLDPGSRSDFAEAYQSSPFVTTDTSGSSTRRTRAVLEGALGWQRGLWSLGITAGYAASDHVSLVSALVRRDRSAMPGIVAGIAKRLGKVRLGGYGRVRHRAETVSLYERLGDTRVYELTGYREAPAIDLSSSNSYYRRMEETVSSLGVSLSGVTADMRWVGFIETEDQSQELTRQARNDPAEDRWKESGWKAGGALQRPLSSKLLLTLQVHALSLSGHGDVALDSMGVIFGADESEFGAEGELRLLGNGIWTGVLSLGFVHQSRVRNDSTARLGTSVSSATPSVGVELGHRLGARLFAALDGEVAFYGPTSTLSNPANRGPVYQYYVAPEYALYSNRANPVALALLLRFRISAGTKLWTSARVERLSSAEHTPIAFSPGGNRSATSMGIGVTVQRP